MSILAIGSERMQSLARELRAFMKERIFPVETQFYDEIDTSGSQWVFPERLEGLKREARDRGLWNLFLPEDAVEGPGLSNSEYAPLCEIMGQVLWAPEVFNCSAPDTGNMEVLLKYGSSLQKERWLKPLLDGEIRSVFCMTEPNVASSDATNIETRIERRGRDIVINGRKWFASGIMNRKAEILIVMGKTDPDADKYLQQSMVLVPRDTPGVRILRPMPVYGSLDAHFGGHAEVLFEDVVVPAENIILGPGRGFEIAQGRLGPGRIHHCMRLVGVAERALATLCERVQGRNAFGRRLAEFETIRADIAQSRAEIEQLRLLTLKAAHLIDTSGAKAARNEIALIKMVGPATVAQILDRAIQAHGAAGVTNDTFLARAWIYARTIRLADGPDEVHRETVARNELKAQAREQKAVGCNQ